VRGGPVLVPEIVKDAARIDHTAAGGGNYQRRGRAAQSPRMDPARTAI